MHICGAEQPSKRREGRPVRVQSVVHCRAESAAVRVVEGPPKPGIFVRVERRLRGRPRTQTSPTHAVPASQVHSLEESALPAHPLKAKRRQTLAWQCRSGREAGGPSSWRAITRGCGAVPGTHVLDPSALDSLTNCELFDGAESRQQNLRGACGGRLRGGGRRGVPVRGRGRRG